MARADQDTAFGLAGALAVHGLLVVALVLNLDWLSIDPPPVQAELWSSLPPERSPTPDPTPKLPSAPEPPPRPEPTPEAEIALEKQKKAQAREAEKSRALEKKREEDKKRQEDRKKQAQRLEKERAAELKRLGLDPKAKPADKGKDTATKAGVANGSAKGERTGREAEWADRVKGLLESRVRYRGANTSDLEVEILLLPTGQLQSARLVTQSNSPIYDQAVLDAIRAMTFPKPPDGLRAVTLKMRHRSD